MSLKLKIAANTFVQILGKLLTGGVTFLVTVMISRHFGVSGYGEFIKIMTYVWVFSLFADFGFNAIVLKKLAETEDSPQENQKYFFNLLGLRLVSGLVLIFLALAILPFLPYQPPNQGYTPMVKMGIIFASLIILAQALLTTTNALFQKRLRYDRSVLAVGIGYLGILILSYLAIKINGPLLLVVGSYLLGNFLMVLVALFLFKFDLGKITFRFDLDLWRLLFWATLPLGLTLILNNLQPDNLILAALRSNYEVGIYGLAKTFFWAALALPVFFMNSVYPVMVKRAQDDLGGLRRMVKRLSILLTSAALILATLAIILAPFLTLIRADFAPSILVFRVLISFLPIFFLTSLLMWLLISLGKQRLLLFIYSFAFLANVSLNLVFVPRFGYWAAVGAVGAAETVALILAAYFSFLFLKGNKE